MTIHWQVYLAASVPISLFALAGWILSLARDKVTHVDCMWPLFIGMSAYVYSLFFYNLHDRNLVILSLVALWALRLCGYLCWRQVNLPTDHRHTTLAQKLAPFYWLKSFYHVFLLYGFLAWLVSISLFSAIQNTALLNNLDYMGIALVLLGITVESIADWQMLQFKKHKENQNNVLTKGLWAFCRHPNYLGELSVWIGFFCIGLSLNTWWSVISPIVVAYLIFFGSGIPAVEYTITLRRPNYQSYQQTTNLIIPAKTANR